MAATAASCWSAPPSEQDAERETQQDTVTADGTGSWDTFVRDLAEDGSVDPSMALQAFSAVVAPLPGVETTPWPEDALRPPSGSLAALWALHHIEEYTPGQQRAISDLLSGHDDGDHGQARADALRDGAEGPAIAAVGSRRTRTDRLLRPPPADDERTREARVIAMALARLLGHELEGQIVVDLGLGAGDVCEGTPSRCRRTFAVASPVVASEDPTRPGYARWRPQLAGALDTCLIQVTVPFEVDLAPREQRAVLAHEVFHCFQYSALDIESALDRGEYPAPWVSEGMASWVGDEYAGHVAVFFDDAVRHWLAVPKEVFARSYDAIGFWQQLHASLGGGGLWRHALGIQRDAAAFNSLFLMRSVAELGGPEFLSRLPAQLVREPDWGPRWSLTLWDREYGDGGPRRTPLIAIVRPALREEVQVDDFSDVRSDFSVEVGQQVVIRAAWDVPPDDTHDEMAVVVRGRGHGTLTWVTGDVAAQEVQLAGDFEHKFCLRESDGTLSNGRPRDELLVAMTGTHEPAQFSIAAVFDACEGYAVPEEAIAAALAEQGIPFTWPCPLAADDGVHCMSVGSDTPHRVEGGHVAYIRRTDEFHWSRYAVLMWGPDVVPSDLPVVPTGETGEWRVRQVVAVDDVPADWGQPTGPSFSPAQRVCLASDGSRCVRQQVLR